MVERFDGRQESSEGGLTYLDMRRVGTATDAMGLIIARGPTQPTSDVKKVVVTLGMTTSVVLIPHQPDLMRQGQGTRAGKAQLLSRVVDGAVGPGPG